MLILVVIQTVVLALMLVLVVSLLKSHAAILRRLHAAGLDDVEASAEHSHDDHDHSQGGRDGIEMDDADLHTVADVPGLRSERGPLVDVAGITPKGSSVAIGIEQAQHATLLAFLSTGCTTCQTFWDAFRADPLLPGGARLVVITKGSADESPAKVADLAPAGATTLMSGEAWHDYAVPGSPYFVLAGPGGRLLGEGSALSWDQVEQLIERALGDARIVSERAREPRERGASRWKAREHDTDEELLAAGIRPGDPSLYPETSTTDGGPDGAH